MRLNVFHVHLYVRSNIHKSIQAVVIVQCKAKYNSNKNHPQNTKASEIMINTGERLKLIDRMNKKRFRLRRLCAV